MDRRTLLIGSTALVLSMRSAAAQTLTTAATLSVRVGNVAYAYREFGPASPADPTSLLLLQRFRGTLDDWDPAFVDALARTRHVVLFSSAGIGSSSGAVASSVTEMAGHTARFIQARGFSSVDVLGWSMGGFAAQALALDHPSLVRRLVLVGTGPGGSAESAPPAEQVFEVALRPDYGFDEHLYLFFAPGREEETRASMERLAARLTREPVPDGRAVEAQAGAIQALMAGETAHFDRLKELGQPTLIVSGDRDPFFPMKNVWLLYRELPDARLSVVPDAGHAPHHQEPAEIAGLIDRFLAGA